MPQNTQPKQTARLPHAPAPKVSIHKQMAQVSASLPPQDRQRVRRACEGCRKKKIKCDGEDPCQRCVSHGVDCFFVDYTNHTKASEQNIEKLENRVASIENLFKQFLDRFTARDMIIKSNYTQAAVDEATDLATAVEDQLSDQRSSNGLRDTTGTDDAEDDNENDICLNDSDPTAQDYSDDTVEFNSKDEVQVEIKIYADGFGELDVDNNGELRYVGLGSTASVVDTCVGLRRHINKGLERKGYSTKEAFFTTPEATSPDHEMNFPPAISQDTLEGKMPPAELVIVLIEIYSKELIHLFPIISTEEINQIYAELLNQEQMDCGFAAIFFAILAVAAPLLPLSHSVYRQIDPKYRGSNIGAAFYNIALSFVNYSSNGKAERKGSSQNIVITVAVLSLYLAETGSQAEAWILIGRAIRLGQDLGLHRSPERLQLPKKERSKRRYIFWCLYSLERQLSTALGRPLSIDDDDCDVETPCVANDGQKSEETAGFTSLILLNKIVGNILRTVNSVKNAGSWREVKKYEELRERVRSANNDLQIWARDQVPQSIKTAKSGTILAEKHIALSSFFSAVMLLHRVFMPNPHRESPLASSQAHLECVKASTKCIRGTTDFLRVVSRCHYLIFHGQNVFVSAVVLLQCIRTSNDSEFVATALEDVKSALDSLRTLEASWTGAKKCRGIVEEYLEFTLYILESDRKGICNFEHGPGENCETMKHNSRKRSEVVLGKRVHTNWPPQKRKKQNSDQREAQSLPGTSRSHQYYQVKRQNQDRETRHHIPQQKNKRRKITETSLALSHTGTTKETHFDEVVGSSLGGHAHQTPPSQNDPFFATFEFDFNNADVPLLGTDFWQFDQNTI